MCRYWISACSVVVHIDKYRTFVILKIINIYLELIPNQCFAVCAIALVPQLTRMERSKHKQLMAISSQHVKFNSLSARIMSSRIIISFIVRLNAETNVYNAILRKWFMGIRKVLWRLFFKKINKMITHDDLTKYVFLC